MEKLIQFIISVEIKELGLKIINGNKLERRTNLSEELGKVKRNLVIDYNEFGMHLPDVDIIIYNPTNCSVIAVISSKVTLRERIAQTGYWKLKLLQDDATKDIKVYFVTPDEDNDFVSSKQHRKGRAIVEVDLDGTYVFTNQKIFETSKVKLFEHFINDFTKLINKSD